MKFGRNSQEIVDKWKEVGFLGGAKYPEKSALIFENTAILMINDEKLRSLKNFSHVETMVFVILHRLINNRGMSFDTIELKDLIEDLCVKCEWTLDLHYASTLGIEAEFCLFYSETYVKK
jgi:hypothetical protein